MPLPLTFAALALFAAPAWGQTRPPVFTPAPMPSDAPIGPTGGAPDLVPQMVGPSGGVPRPAGPANSTPFSGGPSGMPTADPAQPGTMRANPSFVR